MSEVPTVTLSNETKIPILGFGVFQMSDDETEASVLRAIKTGYRLIDTATSYGNEEAVGRAIAKSGVPREELFVTSKLWVADVSEEKAKAAVQRSLDKLGLEYLDLYLIHQPFGDVFGAWRGLEAAYDEGKLLGFQTLTLCKHMTFTTTLGSSRWSTRSKRTLSIRTRRRTSFFLNSISYTRAGHHLPRALTTFSQMRC